MCVCAGGGGGGRGGGVRVLEVTSSNRFDGYGRWPFREGRHSILTVKVKFKVPASA